MDSRIVKRIFSTRNTQETGALLESLSSEARHPQKVLPRTESTVLCSFLHNVGSQCRPDTGDITEKITACRIQIHAYRIDADFHGIVQLFFQKSLIHIILVLPYSQ